jgi:hypothetical protein
MNKAPVILSPSPLTVMGDPAHCRDCGAPISGNYCAACGQETRIETPTVRQFLHELVDQYVAVEGKLGRTLRVLLVQPGQLTLDYLEGRRQRYVRPLKLYLSVSVVFFGLLGIVPDYLNPIVKVDPEAEKEAQQALAEAQADADDDDDAAAKPGAGAPAAGNSAPAANNSAPAAAAPPAPAADGSAPPTATNPSAEAADLKQQIANEINAAIKSGDDKNLGKDIKRTVDEQIKKSEAARGGLASKAKGFASLPAKQQSRLLRAKLADDAPYAMFFLLPYFALLLSWLYRKNGLRYGAHLLFSVHLHCFVFTLLLLGFLPLPSLLRTALWMGIAAYVFLALRRVYGGGWKRTVWREALLAGFYLVAVATTAVSGVLSAVLGGGSS